MPEFLNRISGQLTDFWNKFTTRQKIQISAAFAFIVIALVVLVVVLNRPQYVVLQENLAAEDVNTMLEALNSAGIDAIAGDDAASVLVDEGSQNEATLALAEVGIYATDGVTFEDVTNNGLMTTESERAFKLKEYHESSLARELEMIEGIENVEVELVIPDDTRMVLDDTQQSKASVLITSTQTLEDNVIESIAKHVATAVDNLELENVTIIDSFGRLLFDGESVAGGIGSISSKTDYELQKELMVKSNIRSILLSGGEYDDAMVTVDLVIDFDELETVAEVHTTQDGTNTGIVDSESVYTEEQVNSSTTGVPGTDSNGVTDTLISDGGESTITIEDRNVQYTYNTEQTKAVKAIGGVLYDDSTVTVSLTKYRIYDQTILESQTDGELAGRTWEQFKYDINQQGRTKIAEVDSDIIEIIQMASNIDNVKVIAYEVPLFYDTEAVVTDISDYLLIGVIVVMILLLGYAVYKGTEPVEIQEIEPELSVEDMLKTTREVQEVESIEFDGKSDARVQIENFVENNPDAVALLLRNWLNEDWE